MDLSFKRFFLAKHLDLCDFNKKYYDVCFYSNIHFTICIIVGCIQWKRAKTQLMTNVIIYFV